MDEFVQPLVVVFKVLSGDSFIFTVTIAGLELVLTLTLIFR